MTIAFRRLGLPAAFALVFLAAAWWAWPGGTPDDVPIDVAARGAVVLESPGVARLVPERTWAVTARTAGTVVEILVRPGQAVAEGEAIARTTHPEVLARLEAARDARRAAEAEHAEARDVAAQEIAEAEAERIRADGEADIARMQFEAERQLREYQMGSAIALERARIEAERGRQGARVAALRLEGARARGARKTAAAERTLQGAERELASAEADAAGLVLAAPAAGVVAGTLPRVGEQLQPGQLVVEVVSTRLVAEVDVAEALAEGIAPGQPVRLLRDGREVEVAVASVGARSVGGVVVVGTSALPEGLGWRHDARVEARVRTGEEADAVTVARPPGVAPMAEGFLYVVEAGGGIAARRAVRFGGVAGARVVVREGLEAGERVALVAGTDERIEL